MYVLICNRVVKRNTGSTEKFAPRTANYESLKVSGPFRSFKSAQRAAETALATHTCLDAQVWSAEQVAEHIGKGSMVSNDLYNAVRVADRLLAAYVPKPRPVHAVALKCSSCGVPIPSGTYCDKCDAEIPL